MLAEALNANHIQVLNWNIAKGSRAGWERDLAHLAHASDLVIIQEAKLEYDIPQLFGSECCWTFAPGFTRPDHSTGVMTLDTVAESSIDIRISFARYGQHVIGR